MINSIAKLKRHRDYLFLTLAALVISTAALLIKGAQSEGATSSAIAFLRLGIASACLILLSFKSIYSDVKRCGTGTILRSALAGIFLALHFLVWTKSLEYISVSKSTFLVTTSPIWVAMIGFLVLKETITRQQIIGIMIAMVSALLILHLEDEIFTNRDAISLKGEMLATLGAISIAAYLILGRSLRRTIRLASYVFLTCGFATVTLALYHLHNEESLIPDLSTTAWFYILCLALGPQLIGHTILNWGVRRFHATIVSMTVLAEPILASLLAWTILNEVIRLNNLIGFAGMLLGIFIVIHNKPPSVFISNKLKHDMNESHE